MWIGIAIICLVLGGLVAYVNFFWRSKDAPLPTTTEGPVETDDSTEKVLYDYVELCQVHGPDFAVTLFFTNKTTHVIRRSLVTTGHYTDKSTVPAILCAKLLQASGFQPHVDDAQLLAAFVTAETKLAMEIFFRGNGSLSGSFRGTLNFLKMRVAPAYKVQNLIQRTYDELLSGVISDTAVSEVSGDFMRAVAAHLYMSSILGREPCAAYAMEPMTDAEIAVIAASSRRGLSASHSC